MALLNDFYEFKGSVRTTASPLTLVSGGSASIQETYEIENLSPDDGHVLVSTDAGVSWLDVPAGETLSVFTALTPGATVLIAGNGPLYRVLPVNYPTVTPHEYLYRVKVSPLHSAKVT